MKKSELKPIIKAIIKEATLANTLYALSVTL